MAGTQLDLEGAVAKLQSLAVRERPGDARRPPTAKAGRDTAQRGDQVLGDAVPQHQPGGERVVALGVSPVALDEGHDDVDRRHVGAGARREDVDQAEVVDVLMGDHDQLEVLDGVAEALELVLELVERLAGVRPGVDQGQRPILDQVTVDPADGERRGIRSLWMPIASARASPSSGFMP